MLLNLKRCTEEELDVENYFKAPFMHAFTPLHCILEVLTLIHLKTNPIYSKTQCNAKNACVSGMWQHGFTISFRFAFFFIASSDAIKDKCFAPVRVVVVVVAAQRCSDFIC